MDSQSSVIVYVSETRERPTGNSARPLAYGGVSQRFPLKTNEMVVLGPSFDSPYIFDIALPDWRIRREAKRITLLNQRDPKQIKVLKAPGLQIEEIKNGEGKPRRLSIHVEVGKPARLQKGKTAAQRRSK